MHVSETNVIAIWRPLGSISALKFYVYMIMANNYFVCVCREIRKPKVSFKVVGNNRNR